MAQDELLAKLTRRLDSNERASCEGCLTVDECFQALVGMSRSETPGSDGFPMEFYVAFWEALGADLVRVLNLAFETGQLSTCQRRGLIIVLYKKDDPLETKNWRPISLLNVDYKIATRAISGRLLGVLGSVIGPDQTCGVCGRTISENLSLIRDLLEYVDRENLPLALLSLNQEKAFDRVDWGFLIRILSFNFGPDFINWIRLLYNNIKSAVVINGWTSSFFSPSRGVRQGCPLSPLLYVITIKVLAVCLRTSPKLMGITLPKSLEEFRSSGYATWLPPMNLLRRSSKYTAHMREPPVPNSTEANQKDYGLVPGRLAPTPLMGCVGLNNSLCSVRPSALVIRPFQCGTQP